MASSMDGYIAVGFIVIILIQKHVESNFFIFFYACQNDNVWCQIKHDIMAKSNFREFQDQITWYMYIHVLRNSLKTSDAYMHQ